MTTRMQHLLPLLSVLCLIAARVATAESTAEPLAMIGFHEGARRAVECKDGVLKGVEVRWIEDAWSFAEPFIGAMRLICSSSKLSVEYWGDAVPDDFMFGRLDLNTTKTAMCEGNLGIAGFKWRKAKIKNPDGAEMRQAALMVLCNREGNAPSEVVLAHSQSSATTWDKEFSCKAVAKYAGLATPKLTKALVWYNRKSFAGFEPTECA